MHRYLLIPILILSATSVALADPQDAINDVRKFSGKLREYVVVASPLVIDRGQAAKVKRSLIEILDSLEMHYQCKATKTVEIDSINRSIMVTFVSKTNPVISFIAVAQNGNLVLEQATIGGFKAVSVDPFRLDR